MIAWVRLARRMPNPFLADIAKHAHRRLPRESRLPLARLARARRRMVQAHASAVSTASVPARARRRAAARLGVAGQASNRAGPAYAYRDLGGVFRAGGATAHSHGRRQWGVADGGHGFVFPARIEESVPSASAATMQQSADTIPTTTDLQDGPPLPPTQPADSMIPDQRDDGMQALPADDPAQPAHSAQPREATVSVQIDEQGNPLQVSVQRSSGSATFDNAALLQVQARQFPPTLRDGEPVPATLSVSVSAPSASH